VETSAVGLMDFGDGRSALLDYSIDYGPRAWYELQGTHGTITVRNAWAMRAEDGVLTVLTADGVREHRVPAVRPLRWPIRGSRRPKEPGGRSPQ
jgi:D-xylose 1-dehydrogenase (NADP+, D-xylono-1,5-lactone-forming)